MQRGGYRGKQFVVAGEPTSFFASERNKVRVDPKRKEGDIPSLVLPNTYEQERMELTPRGDRLTLPAISSSASRTSSKGSASMMSTTPQQGHASQSARSLRSSAHLEAIAANLKGSVMKKQGGGASTARATTGVHTGANTFPSAGGDRKAGPPMQLPRLTFTECDTGIRGNAKRDSIVHETTSPHQAGSAFDGHHKGSSAEHSPMIPAPPTPQNTKPSSSRRVVTSSASIGGTPRKLGDPGTVPKFKVGQKPVAAQYHVPGTIMENYRYLQDYDGGVQAADTEADGALAREQTGKNLDQFDVHQGQVEVERAELLAQSVNAKGGKKGAKNSNIDEEASVRVLKSMFQLELTRNSLVVKRLKECDPVYLNQRVTREVGHRKTLCRDEFHTMLCRVLRDDFLNRRDANTLFGVFDSDKSGLVDATEFLTGLLSLVTTGVDDIAFKFINTLLEGREKSSANAFISRFELDVCIGAAQRHYERDPEVVSLLGQLSYHFNFSHHQGRIPVIHLRQKILEDDDFRAIFENLPNPSTHESAARAMFTEDKDGKPVEVHSPGSAKVTTDENEWMSAAHIVADQFMHPDLQRQQTAVEADQPEWWTREGTVYRKSANNPYEEAVFLREK